MSYKKVLPLITILVILALALSSCGSWSRDANCISGVGDWSGCVPANEESHAWLVINGYVAPPEVAPAADGYDPSFQSADAQQAPQPQTGFEQPIIPQQLSQPEQPAGFCQSEPVNPQDGVNVALKKGFFYVIEEYDNGLAIPKHQFHVYSVDTQGALNVWATANSGMRAWECTSEVTAFERAYASARGYKLQHPDHLVIRPDGLEEVSK